MDVSTLIGFVSGLVGVFIGALLTEISRVNERRAKHKSLLTAIVLDMDIKRLTVSAFMSKLTHFNDPNTQQIYFFKIGKQTLVFDLKLYDSHLALITEYLRADEIETVQYFYFLINWMNLAHTEIMHRLDAIESDTSPIERVRLEHEAEFFAKRWLSSNVLLEDNFQIMTKLAERQGVSLKTFNAFQHQNNPQS